MLSGKPCKGVESLRGGETKMASVIGSATSKPQWLDASTQGLMDRTIAREKALSALLLTYILTGLVFMLLPGTFLGVWNLISISKLQAAQSVAPGWIQAHGHAQIFGWVGTFILGIGFYSIPKLRKLKPIALWRAWTCWGMWTVGVLLRWGVVIVPWHWRAILPFSAVLELAAFALFFVTVGPAHASIKNEQMAWHTWVYVVIAGTTGLLLTLILQTLESFSLALNGSSPAFPHLFDQRYLVVAAWGFLVPMVWGFSARWVTVFLGLRPLRPRLLILALGLNSAGVLAALFGFFVLASYALLAGALCAGAALRIFETSAKLPKVAGVHPSFPFFVRGAYVWLVLSAVLGLWASRNLLASAGILGASRHALTVGFVAAMIFSVGQRILPSFCGMHVLASPRLMFATLALLMTGCTLRVGSEILAYQNFAAWAWNVLPVSAVIELTAVTLFTISLVWTFLRPPVVVPSPLTQFVE